MKNPLWVLLIASLFVFAQGCKSEKEFTMLGKNFFAKRIEPGSRPVSLHGMYCHFVVKAFAKKKYELPLLVGYNGAAYADTVFFDSLPATSALRKMLLFNQAGDSSVFTLQAGSLFHSGGLSCGMDLPDDDLIDVYMRTISISNAKPVYVQSANATSGAVENEYQADTGFANFIVRSHLSAEQEIYPGIYKQTVDEGKGLQVVPGEKVILKWKGMFTDGTVFDSNEYDDAFEYLAGTPDQLLKGLQLAVYSMKSGERSMFVLHPALAFGSKGSAGNIVPPNKTLIFELFLEKVASQTAYE
jgi:FKBP-type peptidyl-prolyl cis-trans isomerase